MEPRGVKVQGRAWSARARDESMHGSGNAVSWIGIGDFVAAAGKWICCCTRTMESVE